MARKNKTKWQDCVISIICIGFAYALIPQIVFSYAIRDVSMAWQTIILNIIGLAVMAFCMGTLRFWFTMTCNIVTCLCWVTLFTQKIIY